MKQRGKAGQSKGKTVTPPPCARESNAGDDFHLLWAARRAVRLLDPAGGLKRVLVEKVSPRDEPPLASSPDYFLGVDLSEYYDGEDFQNATRWRLCS